MNRNIIALLIPPAAVARYGCAGYTAAPIGVFWLTGLGGIFYGLTGGMLGDWEITRWFIVALGVLLWAIAAVWSRLVVASVAEDLDHNRSGSLDRRVVPQLDETDPLKEVRNIHGDIHLH